MLPRHAGPSAGYSSYIVSIRPADRRSPLASLSRVSFLAGASRPYPRGAYACGYPPTPSPSHPLPPLRAAPGRAETCPGHLDAPLPHSLCGRTSHTDPPRDTDARGGLAGARGTRQRHRRRLAQPWLQRPPIRRTGREASARLDRSRLRALLLSPRLSRIPLVAWVAGAPLRDAGHVSMARTRMGRPCKRPPRSTARILPRAQCR